MTRFVGLDVSQKLTALCVVDETGRRLWRGQCATDPGQIERMVRGHAGEDAKIGVGTGPMTPWLVHELRARGLDVTCLDAPPPVLAPLADPHDRYQSLTGRSLHVCPACSAGAMRRVEILPATVGRSPRPVGRQVMMPHLNRRPSLSSTPARPRLAWRAGLAAIGSSYTLLRAPRIGAMPGSTAAKVSQPSPLPAAAMPETPHQPLCSRLGQRR